MSENRICPICLSKVDLENLQISEGLIDWLDDLRVRNILESWLFYSKTIHEQALKGTTAQVVSENIKVFEDRIMSLTRQELVKFSDTLSKISEGFARERYLPSEKGLVQELDLLSELEVACADDNIERLGGRGQPDIVAKPRYQGAETGHTVIFEVKEQERWSSRFLKQLQEYMEQYQTPFGILACKQLPAEARTRGFSVSCDHSGIILVTQVDFGALAYQMLRKILIAFHLEGREVGSYQELFKDEEIIDLLTEAKGYSKSLTKIRRTLRSIMKDMDEMQVDLDNKLDAAIQKITVYQQA
jgi:hypothetical protein